MHPSIKSLLSMTLIPGIVAIFVCGMGRALVWAMGFEWNEDCKLSTIRLAVAASAVIFFFNAVFTNANQD